MEPITLYKRASKGKVQQWTIEVEDNRYRTIEGFVGGALTTSAWTAAIPKNVGKSNQTSGVEQAILEAEAKAQKKMEKGYTTKIEDVDEAKATTWLEPMLAYDITKKPKALRLGDEIAIQPKLDGMRCIITKDGMFSRNGKPITSCPHIWEQGQKVLEALPVGARLDGELYHHQFRQDFNALISLVRKSTPLSPQMYDLVQFHAYDVDLPGLNYIDRYVLLEKHLDQGFPKCFQLVDTSFHKVGSSESTTELIQQAQIRHVTDGYEGAMVRLIARDYENKRSDSLLKVKEFLDEEFEILEILEGEGNRAGMAGKIRINVPQHQTTSDAGIAGGVMYYHWLWERRFDLVGKKATVKFFGYTADGKLRFPVMKAVDRQSIEG